MINRGFASTCFFWEFNSFVKCLTFHNNDWLDLNKAWITTFFYSHVQCCNNNKQWMCIYSTSLLYATRSWLGNTVQMIGRVGRFSLEYKNHVPEGMFLCLFVFVFILSCLTKGFLFFFCLIERWGIAYVFCRIWVIFSGFLIQKWFEHTLDCFLDSHNLPRCGSSCLFISFLQWSVSYLLELSLLLGN